MKNLSFGEILTKKMQESSISENAPGASSCQQKKSSHHLQQDLKAEFLWNKFFIQNIAPANDIGKIPFAAKKYAKNPRAAKLETVDVQITPTVVAPKIEVERWVLKTSLDQDGISKWNLFEKTLSQNFGEKLNPRQARTAFRKFLKTIHPDQTGDKSNHNFSTLVKIKDELVAVLENSLDS